MSEQKLRFWRQVAPTPGDVSLVFGDWPGVALRFVTKVQPTPGAVSLVFGAQPVTTEPVTATLAASLPAPTLPALTLAASGELVAPAVYVEGTLAATLPPPTLPAITLEATDYLPEVVLAAALPPPTLPALTLASAVVEYDQALPDAVGPGISARHLATADDPAGLWARQQEMSRIPTPVTAPAQQAAPVASGLSIGQQQMIVASRASGHRWQHGIPLANGQRAAHGDMLRHQRPIIAPAQHGIALGIGARTAHQERIRLRHPLRSDQHQAAPVVTRTSTDHQQGTPLAKGVAVRQQQMIPLPLGWWQIAYPWPEPPPPGIAPSSPVALKFCRLADGTTALVFGCRGAGSGPVVIPVRSVYYVLNESSLVLADTGAPIDHAGLALRLDIDSWAWGWSATVPTAYLGALRPDGADGFKEVIATINGESFRLLVETLSRERRFGRSELRIGGRSLSAWLASPHSPVVTRYNSEARTARQLLDEALTINGVPLGWTVDWQIDDWLVDAGAWSHSGSYIEAAVRIAETPGAVIQPHPIAQVLRVIPRYAGAPWEWPDMTPALSLPESVVTVEGITWADKPRYDAVYLAGAILGHVTRAGTSGGNVAPMVSDPLLTAPDATRQRGRAILSDTGRQAQIRLSLPVLAETGIIVPGRLIDYTESGKTHRGITRAVDVQTGFPAITQTITVETHELEPV